MALAVHISVAVKRCCKTLLALSIVSSLKLSAISTVATILSWIQQFQMWHHSDHFISLYHLSWSCNESYTIDKTNSTKKDLQLEYSLDTRWPVSNVTYALFVNNQFLWRMQLK